MAAISVALASSHADQLTTTDRKTVDVSVSALAEDGVHVAGGSTVGWSDVKHLVFNRPATHASDMRLIFRDGTMVCGVMLRMTREQIDFRTVVAGAVNLPLNQAAAIQLTDKVPLESVHPSPSGIVVVLKSGREVSGSLVAASSGGILIKTSDGLEKSTFDNVACIVFAPMPSVSGPATVLRNGDCLCGAIQWTDKELKTVVAGVPVSVAMDAVAEIRR